MTITQIIDEVLNGEASAASILGVHQTTVQYWKKNGIPQNSKKKYWEKIIKATKGKVSVEILFQANSKIKQ